MSALRLTEMADWLYIIVDIQIKVKQDAHSNYR